MRKYRWCLIAGLFWNITAFAQNRDSSAPAFSEWYLRINPFAFLETAGGIHLGLETNLNKKRTLYLVSEYGYIFLNNAGLNGNNDDDNLNKNPVSGFETKQELRTKLKQKKPGASFFGVELHYVHAGVNNSGWFGMGTPDGFGNYPYMKYQDFRETINTTSIAFKFIKKVYPQEKKWNLEFFAGLGFIYSDIVYKNASGTLVQADRKPLFDAEKKGILPYLAIGGRIILRLK